MYLLNLCDGMTPPSSERTFKLISAIAAPYTLQPKHDGNLFSLGNCLSMVMIFMQEMPLALNSRRKLVAPELIGKTTLLSEALKIITKI